MNAANALRTFIAAQLPGWRQHFGRWNDSADKSLRHAVVRPVGGSRAGLVREPLFTVSLIGAASDDTAAAGATADAFVRALMTHQPDDEEVPFLQPAEPVFIAASDGRPIFDIAVSALTT